MTMPILRPTSDQLSRLRGMVNQIDAIAGELSGDDRSVTGNLTNSIHAVQLHLHRAAELLENAIRQQTSPGQQLGRLPVDTAGFLSMPLKLHPMIDARLYNTLLRMITELGVSERKAFTAQDFLDYGLTKEQFLRQSGAGAKTLAKLELVFSFHGVVIPSL